MNSLTRQVCVGMFSNELGTSCLNIFFCRYDHSTGKELYQYAYYRKCGEQAGKVTCPLEWEISAVKS